MQTDVLTTDLLNRMRDITRAHIVQCIVIEKKVGNLLARKEGKQLLCCSSSVRAPSGEELQVWNDNPVER